MRFSFRIKHLAVVGIAAAALVVLLITSSLIARRVGEHMEQIQRLYLPRIGLLPQLAADFERLRRGLQDAVAAADAKLLDETAGLRDKLLDELDAKRDALDPVDRDALRASILEYYAGAMALSRRMLAGETGETVVADIQAMQALQLRTSELLARVASFDKNELTAVFSDAEQEEETAARVRLVISASCLLVVALLAMWISRGLVRSLDHLAAGIRRFGGGDFSTPIPILGRDELGDVAWQANHMAESLRQLGDERERVGWLKSGAAGLADELRGALLPGEVADRAVGFLCRYLGAPLGALYRLEDDGRLHQLGTRAGLATDGRAGIALGEGLIGQAALSQELKVVPGAGALVLQSGVAALTPRALVFLPLAHLGKVSGVVELAVCEPWTELRAELLAGVRETVAIAVEVACGRAATVALLAETRRQHGELETTNSELVDARRRLEHKADELARTSEYKSRFLANMSHELRTPLNAIIGFTEILFDGTVAPASAQGQEFLGDILTSGRHLLQLINDVLDLSKVEAGKLEFRPARLHLDEVVGEVLGILRGVAADKAITLSAEVDPELDDLWLDPARLKQVLYNYVSNALKFTPAKGRVIVRARPDGTERLRLEVEDSGVGITAADLERLFVEFQQLDGASRAAQDGTGLGLALTRRLVEAQGGSVGANSTVGVGSVFWARLPRRATVAAVNDTEPAGLTIPNPGEQRGTRGQ